MRTLITGGAGFIGSHLAEHLLSRGDSVTILDDLSTGSIENVAQLKADRRFSYVVDSVTKDSIVAELVDSADAVFHLAAAVGVFKIVQNPVETIQLNIQGTERVLTHAAKKRRPVLIASTSEVYGKGSKVPFSEEDDIVLGPSSKSRWCYACSKLVDEHLALAYWSQRRVPTVVARLFNTVGPRQSGQYGMVVPRFVRQALSGGPLTVYGDGRQSRCFAHVKDVVTALAALLAAPACYGRVFNVGNDQEISIQELAEKVRSKTDPAVRIQQIPYEKAYAPGFEDLRRRVPSLTRIREAISFAPSRTIDHILDDVIAYERAHHRAVTGSLPTV
ncbi:MAG TPA: NAD-dependent epimerase/dehydratase family protein [Planctomycetota bacterium]|nr:NAD-dependent epimerase/dehydratase family protein [Planctomycetota bacterium]